VSKNVPNPIKMGIWHFRNFTAAFVHFLDLGLT